jgi:site-specific recombinase XerD
MRLPLTVHQETGLNQTYLTAYKEWLARQPISSNTARAYHSRVKQFLVYLYYAELSDKFPLNDPSGMSNAVQMYLNFLKQSTKRGATINANINALNNFFQFLGVKPVPCKRERCCVRTAKTLTLAQQKRLLSTFDRQCIRDKALALVLFFTGLRVGDCARLEMRNIGPGAASIIVGDGVNISLNQETTFALRKWLDEREALVGANLETRLWLTKKGTRLTIAGITWVIERIGWQSGLAISAETLRRTCLTQATNSFSKDVLAANFGGHVAKATLKRYATPSASNFVSGNFNTPKVGLPSI